MQEEAKKENELLPQQKRELGLLKGMATLPDDFDEMFKKEIEEIFNGMI